MSSPEPEATLATVADELRAALQAVELERRRLAAVLEALPVGVAIADATGKVTHFNAALTRIWGRPPTPQSADEYNEWRARWVRSGEPLAAEDWAMARALRTGEVVHGDVVEIERFDGEGRLVILNAAAPIKDDEGRVIGGVVAEMDITAQSRAEDALRQSEARYRAVVENTSAIILRLDPQGIVRYANQRALECFGYAAEELIGRPALGTILPERDSQRADLNENMRKGGERVWVEWTNSEMYDHEGRLTEFLSVGIDVTARRRIDAALASANARLVEADRRKDEFLAMLGHELRNPLGVIAGAIRLMDSPELGPEALGKVRAAAERQSAHMTRLVDELLDVARITEGKVTLRREELEIAGVIEMAVESARPLLEARGQRLLQAFAREPLLVTGDPVRLAQAVGNLLNNAAKYTPVNGEIRLIVERHEDQVVVAVCDNGPGIAPDLLPRVFDLFVQGERGADRSQGGLGVGLTLARRLVEMHGGRLEAASAGPGQGSQFTMTLPLASVQTAPAAHAGAGPTATPSRRRLLVVDDNRDAADMLTLHLRLEGYDARAVYDGSAALRAAASQKPDGIVLDVGMPGMDGYEVARRVREDPAHDATVLIALTGYGQDEDIAATHKAGFDHHLVKPVDMEALREAIDASPTARTKASC